MMKIWVFFAIILLCTGRTIVTEITSNLCCLPPDAGACHSPTPRYYYNCLGGYCDSFVYSGCEGNSNNFVTLRECEQYCI